MPAARTRVKICGVCRVEDAVLAARSGADAIGIALHPAARRHVPHERARAILDAIPPFVTPVGIFVDADAEDVLHVARSLGLRHVQLNGHETPETVDRLRGLVVLKAVRVDPSTFGAELDRWRDAISRLKLNHLRGLVLETANTGQPGGSGVANDWATIARSKRDGNFDELPPVIVAGGLTPETVGDVVREIRPWAVDVSSGVEERLGEKSPRKVDDFIAAVHGVG